MPRLVLSLALGSLALGCADDPDACAGSDEPVVELGVDESGPFVPLVDGATVSIADAPQGGFGVPVRARTRGLVAGNTSSAEILLDLRLDAAAAGHFEIPAFPLLCEGAAQGGTLGTVVVPLDPDTWVTAADLEPLAGRTAELAVEVIDDDDRSAVARANVVLQLPE